MKKITLLFCLFSLAGFSQTIGISVFATGLSNPVEITNAGDSRLFVVQKGGAIRIVNPNGTINATNFLTLPNTLVLSGGEQGLLGLAFHPDYATNGYFYVNYTRQTDGATVIARYSVTANPNVADPASAVILLTIAQPFANHNGGTLRFGPDGYLYIGMGDGGDGGDPGNRAQNINENLGKLLRLDVDAAAPYIPAGNPYVGVAGNDEIWAIGLRNPWKWSFDKVTNDLWIADVGQGAVEEINHVTGNGGPGLNYGWKCYEGNSVFTAGCAVPTTTYTFPIATYPHSGANSGCSITGGYVYRGSAYPAFTGKFFFADYCTGGINTVNIDGSVTYNPMSAITGITSFGQDIAGELYFCRSTLVYKIFDNDLGLGNFRENGFAMFPNPANAEVSIRNTSERLLSNFRLYDLSGKLLMEQKLDNIETNIVNTSSLQSGLYVATVEDSSGARFTSKLTIK
jgi:glucose/arabinose dehydrogenase